MQRNNWLQLVLLPITIAIMFTAWFEPWVQWLVRSTGIGRASVVPPPLIMIAVILVSTLITRYALNHARYERRIVLVSGFAVLVGVTWLMNFSIFPAGYVLNLLDWQNSVSPELFILLAIGVLWWRGILIGRSRALIDENVERTFFNGILALAGLMVVDNFTRHVPAPDILAAVLLFFLTALTALIIVNIERAHVQQAEAGFWRRQRHWLGTALAVVCAILLAGVALAGLLSPDVLRQTFAALGPAVTAVGNLLVEILKPIITLIFSLIAPLVPLLQAVLRVLLQGIMGVLSILHELGAQVNAPKVQQQIEGFLDSPEFVSLARGSTVVVILIILALLALWALHRSGLLSRKNLDETRESIASRELLFHQLKSLFARRHARTESRSGYLALSEDDPRAMVRRAYQGMLQWAAIRVGERAPHQTPSIYADQIARVVPTRHDELLRLTALYQRARYASEDMTAADAQSAQSALVRLQELPVIQSPVADE